MSSSTQWPGRSKGAIAPTEGREEGQDRVALYSLGLSSCFPYVVHTSIARARAISAHLIALGGGHAVTSEAGPRTIYLSKYSREAIEKVWDELPD